MIFFPGRKIIAMGNIYQDQGQNYPVYAYYHCFYILNENAFFKSVFPPYDLVLILSNISSCIPPMHTFDHMRFSFVNGNRSLTRSQFYKIKRANEIAYRHNGFFLVSFIQGHAWIETNRRKAITSDFNSTSCCHFNSFKYIFFHQ